MAYERDARARTGQDLEATKRRRDVGGEPHGAPDQRDQPGAACRAPRPALEPPARGVARRLPGGAAARYFTPCGAFRGSGFRGAGGQGDRRAPGGARVRAAQGPAPAGHTGGRPGRGGDGAGRRGRQAAGVRADHPAPQGLAAVPFDVRVDHAPQHGEAPHGRARRPPGEVASDGLRVGRLLVVQRALPARRGRLRRVSGGRRDRPDPAHAQPWAARLRHRAGTREHRRRADGPGSLRLAPPVGRPGAVRGGDRTALRRPVARADPGVRLPGRQGPLHRPPDPCGSTNWVSTSRRCR